MPDFKFDADGHLVSRLPVPIQRALTNLLAAHGVDVVTTYYPSPWCDVEQAILAQLQQLVEIKDKAVELTKQIPWVDQRTRELDQLIAKYEGRTP